MKLVEFSFNTSYVVIKHWILEIATHTMNVSIHLMLLLNTNVVVKEVDDVSFQYILCCY